MKRVQSSEFRVQGSRGRAAGFTLLEVMLAVTILALVITAVASTWNAALTGWKRGTEALETFQRERVVMATLEELTSSAVFVSGGKPDLYRIIGEHKSDGDTVSFVTASDALLPASEAVAGGMRRVTLRVNQDSRGNPVLAIANRPAMMDKPADSDVVWHVLSADVTGLAVRYRNARDHTWKDQWDDASMIPEAIEFTVTFAATRTAEPVVVTRGIDLPAAPYILSARGEVPQAIQPPTSTQTPAGTIPSPPGGHP